MTLLRRATRLLLATAIVTLSAMIGGGSVARACSCASIDPIDAIADSDVVFTGTVVNNSGTEFEPRWQFDVDGVVKGDVASTEIVSGEDSAVGCGTDFGRFIGGSPVVVYTTGQSGGLRARGCMPTPDAESFASMLSAADGDAVPDDAGPPVVLVAGRIGTANLHLLDVAGNVVGAGALPVEPGAIAHCPGTTLAAAWSYGAPVESDGDSDGPLIAGLTNVISIIDLESMDVVEQRTIVSDFVSLQDRIRCLDGGERVIVGRGFGPNEGRVTVASSNVDPSLDASVDDTATSRVLIHPSGTVVLLPSVAGGAIRLLTSDSLTTVDSGSGIPLGDEVATTHGAFSADGSRLAVLATVSGEDVQYDTGATHVIVLDVADGVPSAERATRTELPEALDGSAMWIEWLDDDTWVVERETFDSKLLDIVTTDGMLVSRTDVGWGWGLVPVDGELLRARNGGVEFVDRQGSRRDASLAPDTADVYRQLFLAPLVNAPAFDLSSPAAQSLTVRPVVSGDRNDDEGQPAPAEPPSAENVTTEVSVVDPNDTPAPTLLIDAATGDGDSVDDTTDESVVLDRASFPGDDNSATDRRSLAPWGAVFVFGFIALVGGNWMARRRRAD